MHKHEQGVLDTSVVIDLNLIDLADLPRSASITAVTLAELTAGPLTTRDPAERAKRLNRLQWVEGKFEALPFDVEAARAYGRIYAASLAVNQKPRGGRAIDLMIVATALSRSLPLYTRNPRDFAPFSDLLEILPL